MQIPLQISSNNLVITNAIEASIKKFTKKLERFYPNIISCRVSIRIPNKHHHNGRIYNVRFDIYVPNKEIAITKQAREDLYGAIHDAFSAAKRQLEDHLRLQKKLTKHHEIAIHGRIVQLQSDQECGYIESRNSDDRLYFHRSNVKYPEFEQLKVGDEVQFLAEMGIEGPHAVRVTLCKQH